MRLTGVYLARARRSFLHVPFALGESAGHEENSRKSAKQCDKSAASQQASTAKKKRGTHLERARGFHGDSLRRSSYTRISRGYLPSRLASLGDAYVEYLAGACTMNLRGKAQATAHACARAQTLAQACGLFDRAAYLLLDGFTLDAVGGPLSASAARQPAAGKRPCRSPPGWGRGPAPLRGAGAGRLGTPRRALSLHFRASLLPRALQACDAPKKFPTLEYWRFASGVFRNNCDAQTGQEKRKPRARSSIVSSAVAGFFFCFAASARSQRFGQGGAAGGGGARSRDEGPGCQAGGASA